MVVIILYLHVKLNILCPGIVLKVKDCEGQLSYICLVVLYLGECDIILDTSDHPQLLET
jgi:hypothetical protein